MNKKAQIVYYFIPIIALVSCTATVITMLSARENLNAQADSISDISNELEFTQAIINSKLHLILKSAVAACPDCNDRQLKDVIVKELEKSEIQFRYIMDTNAFAKIRNKEFSISSDEKQYTLSIDKFELFIKNNGNEFKRTSSLTIIEPKGQ